MKRVVFFLYFINILWGVDIALESKNIERDNVASNRDKIFFGESLFHGHFKESKQLMDNPNYLLNIGDIVSIKLWGAFEYAANLKIDKKGNIFIPKVGTIHLLGVRSEDLKEHVRRVVKRVFNSNVFVYATLNTYNPISVFVTGGVEHPGLYEGISSDSVLQFLDKAGGVKKSIGSYRDITVLRHNRVVKKFDLYEFLLQGKLVISQFQNGDVIKVANRHNIISIEGEVERGYIFELLSKSVSVDEIIPFVLPKPTVTHFMITRWNHGHQTIEKHAMSERYSVVLNGGEKINFISDYLKDNITINIVGEHANLHTLSVQKGTTLKDLLSELVMTPLSDADAVQLYRKSIARKQKQLIDANLKDLEARILTTGSSTTEEAKIRKEESALVLDFIERASKVEPKGQVIINDATDLSEITLEDGDKIFIPKKSHIVVVEGEVSLPNAQTFVPGYTIADYIASCGGFSPRANQEKVLLVKKNGKVITYNATSWWDGKPLEITAGDAILVLGKVDSKNIQITSSVTQILYQIAVGAAVVLRAF
jgi:protein involved in polysaccharide export with SLBB domain